ncbi:MAG: L,D-transpeptidase family protein [Paracoccaceae bacterium]
MTPDDLVLTSGGVHFRGQRFPCSIGKSGITLAKQEGDGATPAGLHHIVGCLYRADRVEPPNTWAKPLRLGDCWSDDPRDPAYNQLVQSPREFSHEALWRGDRLYDIILLTDWNWRNPVSGAGSAIFLHRWRRPGFPTEGCIAFRMDNLARIARHAVPGTRLIVRR